MHTSKCEEALYYYVWKCSSGRRRYFRWSGQSSWRYGKLFLSISLL